MAKVKTRYVCSECGHVHPQWVGQCAQCKSWNTLEEESVGPVSQRAARSGLTALQSPKSGRWLSSSFGVAPLGHGRSGVESRARRWGRPWWGRLLGGEPGIGKSTLMLQVALRLAKRSQSPVHQWRGECRAGEDARQQAGSIAPSVLIFPQTQVAILDALRTEDPGGGGLHPNARPPGSGWCARIRRPNQRVRCCIDHLVKVDRHPIVYGGSHHQRGLARWAQSPGAHGGRRPSV